VMTSVPAFKRRTKENSEKHALPARRGAPVRLAAAVRRGWRC
jgi:hypothetical protein